MADMSAVNRGEYPVKQNPLTLRQKLMWGGMILYSLFVYAQISVYYVWGGN